MIYPKKISARKTDWIINSLIIFSILLGIILTIINNITTPNIKWSALCNLGIIWVWLTVIYSIKKDVNIAGYVLIETIIASVFITYMDYNLHFGYNGWSTSIGIPIITILANFTMFVLTIVNNKSYIKYIIYHFVLMFFSIISILYIYFNIVKNIVMSSILIGIVFASLLLSLVFCIKDIKEAFIRKFHM